MAFEDFLLALNKFPMKQYDFTDRPSRKFSKFEKNSAFNLLVYTECETNPFIRIVSTKTSPPRFIIFYNTGDSGTINWVPVEKTAFDFSETSFFYHLITTGCNPAGEWNGHWVVIEDSMNSFRILLSQTTPPVIKFAIRDMIDEWYIISREELQFLWAQEEEARRAWERHKKIIEDEAILPTSIIEDLINSKNQETRFVKLFPQFLRDRVPKNYLYHLSQDIAQELRVLQLFVRREMSIINRLTDGSCSIQELIDTYYVRRGKRMKLFFTILNYLEKNQFLIVREKG